MKQYTMILDYSMYKNIMLHGIANNVTNDVSTPLFYDLWRKGMISAIFKTLEFLEADEEVNEVIVAIDYGNWRVDFNKEYKAERSVVREASPIDYEVFNLISQDFLDELVLYLPFKGVKCWGAEADDVIGTLIINEPNKNWLLASSDKDFFQLRNFSDNIKQYNPRTKTHAKFIPELQNTQVHAMMGDKIDGVSSVKKGIGMKKSMKMINEGILDAWLDDNGLREKYEHNLTLVDLTRTPEKIQLCIVEDYKNQTKNLTFNKMQSMKFLATGDLEINIYLNWLSTLAKENKEEAEKLRRIASLPKRIINV